MTRTLMLSEGALTVETVEQIGGATHETRVSIAITEMDAQWLVTAIVDQFDLQIKAPKLLPRKVFEALPQAQKSDVMARGFQLYDYEEDLEDGALIYDVRLRPNA